MFVSIVQSTIVASQTFIRSKMLIALQMQKDNLKKIRYPVKKMSVNKYNMF